ncbi:MAG: hypothetical protein ACK5HR_06000 [Mycoplasmatales bacterium]
MNKISKCIIVFVLLIGGFFFGRLSTNINFDSKTVSFIDSDKVVFVNNDQTKSYNENNYNFGNIEINKLLNMEEYKTNKIEIVNSLEANSGLKRGDYGATIVIPSNFTESILSINNDTASKSEMIYEISNTLSPKNQNEMVKTINSIVNSIKSDISYMYIYSIFDSLHTSQAGIDTVISNMEYVYGFADSLDSVDVFNNYEYELDEYKDYDLDKLDLTKQEQEYVSIISNYISEIDNSIVLLQEDIQISNQDFMEYLISINGNFDKLINQLEKKMTDYENLVSSEMATINNYTSKLDLIDIQMELDLIKEILENKIENLSEVLSDIFGSEQKELKYLLDLYKNINNLIGLSLNFNGEIEHIDQNNTLITKKNNELLNLDFIKYISNYIESSNEIDKCLKTKDIDQNDCLNNNLNDLSALNTNINKNIDNFQTKFNNNFNDIDIEVNEIISNHNHSEDNLLKYIEETNNNVIVNTYKDIIITYKEIQTDIISIIDNNTSVVTDYNTIKDKLNSATSLTKRNINKINSIISKDEEEIDTNDLNKIEKICKGKYKTEISCSIIQSYENTKDIILNIENALQPQKSEVIDSEVEYIDESCSKPMSIAYIYAGWSCTEDGENKHYWGINKKLMNQNITVNNIGSSLTILEDESKEALNNIGETVDNISDIEINLDNYKKVDYKEVDSSPYLKDLKNVNQSAQEELDEVKESNNNIYEDIYDTYMTNVESYQDYIDKVSNDTTYEDMIDNFTINEDKRQEESLSYLERLANLMTNTLTEDMPNKNIYNHIADPITYIGVDNETIDATEVKDNKISVNWYYVLIVFLLFIIIGGVIIIIRKKA